MTAIVYLKQVEMALFVCTAVNSMRYILSLCNDTLNELHVRGKLEHQF